MSKQYGNEDFLANVIADACSMYNKFCENKNVLYIIKMCPHNGQDAPLTVKLKNGEYMW